MKRALLCVVSVLLLACSVAACGGKTGKLHNDVSNQANSAQVQQATTKAESEVQGCLNGNSLLTHGDRQKFESCLKGLVPPAKQQQVASCAEGKAFSDVTHGNTKAIVPDAAGCVAAAEGTTPSASTTGSSK